MLLIEQRYNHESNEESLLTPRRNKAFTLPISSLRYGGALRKCERLWDDQCLRVGSEISGPFLGSICNYLEMAVLGPESRGH